MKLGQPRRQDQCQQICSTFIVEGTGVEQMKNGEKRKLTPPNPMRNVGLAVNIFSYSVTSIRGVFSTSVAQFCEDTGNGDITFLAPNVWSLLGCFHEKGDNDNVGSNFFHHLYHILISRGPWQHEIPL